MSKMYIAKRHFWQNSSSNSSLKVNQPQVVIEIQSIPMFMLIWRDP